MRPPAEVENDLQTEIRSNAAFEDGIIAVLIGSGIGVALTFAFNIISAIMIVDGLLLDSVLSAALGALLTGFLIFLAGFLSGFAVIFPLFRMQEKQRQRNARPYYASAFLIAVAVFVLMQQLPGSSGSSLIEALVSIFIPAMVIAHIFVGRIRRLWRAAEKAETAAAGRFTLLQ